MKKTAIQEPGAGMWLNGQQKEEEEEEEEEGEEEDVKCWIQISKSP
jgi:hypothetical protein